MFERDYLKREMQKLAAAIASIVDQRKAGKLPEAKQEIANAYEELGFDSTWQENVDTPTLAALLRDRAKVVALGRIMALEGEILGDEGAGDRGQQRARRAIELLLEARSEGEYGLDAEIAALAGKVDAGALSPRAQRLIKK